MGRLWGPFLVAGSLGILVQLSAFLGLRRGLLRVYSTEGTRMLLLYLGFSALGIPAFCRLAGIPVFLRVSTGVVWVLAILNLGILHLVHRLADSEGFRSTEIMGFSTILLQWGTIVAFLVYMSMDPPSPVGYPDFHIRIFEMGLTPFCLLLATLLLQASAIYDCHRRVVALASSLRLKPDAFE